MLTIEQDDFHVWAYFSNELAQKLKCHAASFRELWAYCLQKRICFTGVYTCYEVDSDYRLNYQNSFFGMPCVDTVMQAKRGKFQISEEGVTTYKTELVNEESFMNRFYFLPEHIEDNQLNKLGREKIEKMLPRTFYLINKMGYAKSIEMVKSDS